MPELTFEKRTDQARGRGSAERLETLPTGRIMSYSEFTLEAVERHLGVTTQEADLFPDSPTAPVPDWLPEWLRAGRDWPS